MSERRHKAENLNDDDRRRLAVRSRSGKRMLGPLEWDDCGHGKRRVYRWVWEIDGDVEDGDVDIVESPDCFVCYPDDDVLENPARNPYAEVESLLPCRGCGAPLPRGYRAWMSDHFGGWFCQKACDMAARRRAARAVGRQPKPGPWRAKPGRVANPQHPRGALVPIEMQKRHGVDLHGRPVASIPAPIERQELHGLDHLGRPRKNPRRNATCPDCGAKDAYTNLRGQIDCAACSALDLTQAFDAAVNADARSDDAGFVRFASVWAHRLHGSRDAGERAIAETMRVDGADSRIEALRIMVFG